MNIEWKYKETIIGKLGDLLLARRGRYTECWKFSLQPRVYFNPLVGGVRGTIKIIDYTLFDTSYEWQLLDRIDIYP